MTASSPTVTTISGQASRQVRRCEVGSLIADIPPSHLIGLYDCEWANPLQRWIQAPKAP
jgi:hypothetical protein